MLNAWLKKNVENDRVGNKIFTNYLTECGYCECGMLNVKATVGHSSSCRVLVYSRDAFPVTQPPATVHLRNLQHIVLYSASMLTVC